jgi:GMP synthase (glutamine-hydrolysing)
VRPVLLVGHEEWETFGLAPSSLTDTGVPWREHLAHTGAGLPELSEISGIILFGGVMNVDETDRFPYLADEHALVRSAVDADVPYLGICLGAQMLARALDHPVYRAGIREIGFHPLHPTPQTSSDPLLSAFDDGDRVFHWHEDTFDLPEGSTQLATGDPIAMQAFRYSEAAWGLQFHIEVDRAEIELWLKIAGEDGVVAWGSTTERIQEQLDAFVDGQERRSREVFGRFAEIVRRRER